MTTGLMFVGSAMLPLGVLDQVSPLDVRTLMFVGSAMLPLGVSDYVSLLGTPTMTLMFPPA